MNEATGMDAHDDITTLSSEACLKFMNEFLDKRLGTDPKLRNEDCNIAGRTDFNLLVGWFNGNWGALDASMAIAIAEARKISDPLEAQKYTASLRFSDAVKELRKHIVESGHLKKDKIITLLDFMDKESKRNAFAHGYVWSNKTHVKFFHRENRYKQPFVVEEHTFTLDEFKIHVAKVARANNLLRIALDQDDGKKKLNAFMDGMKKAIRTSSGSKA